jgi:hypothetical protein
VGAVLTLKRVKEPLLTYQPTSAIYIEYVQHWSSVTHVLVIISLITFNLNNSEITPSHGERSTSALA